MDPNTKFESKRICTFLGATSNYVFVNIQGQPLDALGPYPKNLLPNVQIQGGIYNTFFFQCWADITILYIPGQLIRNNH